MSNKTKPNEKFAKARQYIRERVDIKAKLPNYSHMQWRALYKALELIGVVWDKQQRIWYMGRLQDNTPHITVKQPTRTSGSTKDTVLVRIITDRGNIEEVAEAFLELTEAIDLTVIKQSEPINSKYGDSQRVYFTLKINKAHGQ